MEEEEENWRKKLRRTDRPKKMGHIKNRGTWKWGEIEPTIYNKTGERARVMPKSIMNDYFKMYKRMHNRLPTLKEIEEEEGRPLTVDEINDYHDEYNRVV
tara:strand:+ start:889 stop:1188 length:300 start_codon:yes stop_codon:yes gene_type:complete